MPRLPPNARSLIPRHYERRAAAARRGEHLPSEEELLLGMPFLGEKLEKDVREFAVRFERTLARRGAGQPASNTLELLREIAINPASDNVAELEASVAADPSSLGRSIKVDHLSFDEARRVRLRCRVYRASWGDYSAMVALAADVLSIGTNALPDDALFLRWILRALELLATSGTLEGFDELVRRRGWINSAGPDDRLTAPFDFETRIRRAIQIKQENERPDREQPTAADADREAPVTTPIQGKAVVVWKVGNATTSEGKKVAEALKPLVGIPLSSEIETDPAEARQVMRNEFPHAIEVTEAIFRRLARARRVEPTIIVGRPGSGKSRYAKLLGASLGLPTDVLPFGGMADSSIMGTARRWSTGEPTFALASIMRHQVANPLLVIDEVEKTSDGGHNGNALNALLALLEPETAARYHDPWVQAPVDLSNISWLMTANSIGSLPHPLRDRCRVLSFPSPGREHVDRLLPRLLRDIAEHRGDMLGGDLALDGIERLALDQWKDGSLRTLSKMLSQILEDRERRQRERPN